MSTQVKVPGDFTSLEVAIESGAQHIELCGVHPAGLELRGPLWIRGGVIQGDCEVALRVLGDVELIDVEVHNSGGDGIRIEEGSPSLKGLEVRVSGEGISCRGQSRARIEDCEIHGEGRGLVVQDQACPDLRGLEIESAGGAVCFRDRASASGEDWVLRSSAETTLEICGESRPILKGIQVEEAGRCGIFIHGEARPELSELRVEQSGLAGLEVTGSARPRIFDLTVIRSASGAVLISGDSAPEIRGVKVDFCSLAALEVKGDADPVVDGIHVVRTDGSGLYLHERSQGTYMEVHLEDTTLCGIEAKGEVEADLEAFHLYSGRAGGIWVREQARVEALDCNIRRQGGIAVEVRDQGQLLLESSIIKNNMDTAFQASGNSTARLKDCEWMDNSGDGLVLMGAARCRIEGGRSHPSQGLALRLGGTSRMTHTNFAWVGEVEISPGAQLVEAEADA